MTIETILSAYLKEFPFTQGEHSANRERYYFLSGFLRSVQAGEDDETLWAKHGGKVDRGTGDFLKRQMNEK